MTDFSSGKIKILVSTTVIEVGINVPNASLMIMKTLSVSDLHSCISLEEE